MLSVKLIPPAPSVLETTNEVSPHVHRWIRAVTALNRSGHRARNRRIAFQGKIGNGSRPASSKSPGNPDLTVDVTPMCSMNRLGHPCSRLITQALDITVIFLGIGTVLLKGSHRQAVNNLFPNYFVTSASPATYSHPDLPKISLPSLS